MSMPSIDLKCDRCSYEACSRLLWGNYNYVYTDPIDSDPINSEPHKRTILCNQEASIDLDRELGWCFSCNEFKAIESLSTKGFIEIVRACEEQIAQLTQSTFRLITLKLSKKKQQKYTNLRAKLMLAKQLLELFPSSDSSASSLEQKESTDKAPSKRKPKCLSCGSYKVEAVNADFSLPYENRHYRGAKYIGFKHPDCEGEFFAAPNDLRLHMRFYPMYFDINGNTVTDGN
jgi:hypothetical protein